MKLYSHYQKNSQKSALSGGSWENYAINDALTYSYRKNLYDACSFPSNLHYHDYYELLLIEHGDIRYICESQLFYPNALDIILIPPGKFHMSAINGSTTEYARHVFYFEPNAFELLGCPALSRFTSNLSDGMLISLPPQRKALARELLDSLYSTLSDSNDEIDQALVISYVLQFFHTLNQGAESKAGESVQLPEMVLKLKSYIDESYSTIKSSTQVAERFFYTREHAARMFKKHFEITIADYVLQKRILESQKLILSGASITDAAYAVGFNSLSSFIHGFRKITGLSPSEYKKKLK